MVSTLRGRYGNGGIAPGLYTDAFDLLNGPLNRWTDETMGCEGGARIAVVSVSLADRRTWSAEGEPWPPLSPSGGFRKRTQALVSERHRHLVFYR